MPGMRAPAPIPILPKQKPAAGWGPVGRSCLGCRGNRLCPVLAKRAVLQGDCSLKCECCEFLLMFSGSCCWPFLGSHLSLLWTWGESPHASWPCLKSKQPLNVSNCLLGHLSWDGSVPAWCSVPCVSVPRSRAGCMWHKTCQENLLRSDCVLAFRCAWGQACLLSQKLWALAWQIAFSSLLRSNFKSVCLGKTNRKTNQTETKPKKPEPIFVCPPSPREVFPGCCQRVESSGPPAAGREEELWDPTEEHPIGLLAQCFDCPWGRLSLPMACEVSLRCSMWFITGGIAMRPAAAQRAARCALGS